MLPTTGQAPCAIIALMEIFLSWSGRRSKAAAEALRIWLPKVNPAFKPWLSTADIDKGARWASDVAERLETARAGIICITPGNLHADWILWEAGALSKTIKNTYVCTLLIELDPADVKPPLSQFQATKMTKEDILALLSTLNGKLEDRAIPVANLPETFELWWPKLEAELKKLPPDEGAAQPQRSDRDLIEEILALVRSQTRRSIPSKQQREALTARKISEALEKALFSSNLDMNTLSVNPEEGSFSVAVDTPFGYYRFMCLDSVDAEDFADYVVSNLKARQDEGRLASSGRKVPNGIREESKPALEGCDSGSASKAGFQDPKVRKEE